MTRSVTLSALAGLAAGADVRQAIAIGCYVVGAAFLVAGVLIGPAQLGVARVLGLQLQADPDGAGVVGRSRPGRRCSGRGGRVGGGVGGVIVGVGVEPA